MTHRLERIVGRLGIRPGQHVLEIGCGHGVAAGFVCERLAGKGRYLAIDRSDKMIAAALRRNAAHVATGLAEFRVARLEAFDPDEERFDWILAVRVGLFHREPERARAIAAVWLAPGGRLEAVFDTP